MAFSSASTAIPTPLGSPGVVQFGGSGKTAAGDPYGNKWGPRFGFAYSLNDKTVVRGGYAFFFAPQFAIGSPLATVGYNATTSYTAGTNGDLTSLGSLSNPFPARISQPVGKSLGTSTGLDKRSI